MEEFGRERTLARVECDVSRFSVNFIHFQTQAGNMSQINATYGTSTPGSESREMYRILVPIMIVFCTLTFTFNIFIVVAAHWMRRPLTPTMYFNLSLAGADAIASLILGLGLVLHRQVSPVLHYCNMLYEMKSSQLRSNAIAANIASPQ